MTPALATVAFVVLGCVAVMIIVVLWSVIREGPNEIGKLRRKGYGVGALVRGDLSKSDAGATIDVMEGLEFVAKGSQIQSVRPTRTLSGEIS